MEPGWSTGRNGHPNASVEVEGGSLAGAHPGVAAKEDQRVTDRQSPQCDEDARRGSEMGVDNAG